MKKKRIILLLFISFLFLFFCKKLIFKDRNTLININDLSQEFIDDYFKKISNVKSEDVKDNMLIVISNNKIKDSYGAKMVMR